MGVFQPWALISDGLEWGTRNASQASGYLRYGRSPFIAAALIALLLTFALLPHRLIERLAAAKLWGDKWFTVGIPALLIALTALAWMPWMKTTRYHRYLLAEAVTSLSGSEVPDGGESLSALAFPRLAERYRLLAGSPAPAPSAFFGAAKGYDVLFFVMETMPSVCLSFDGPLDDYPNFASLKPASWVAASHQTTYPLTVRALFSVMTGTYPPDSGRTELRLTGHASLGIAKNLEGIGYRTGLYSGSLPSTDREAFEYLGFQTIYPSLTRPFSMDDPGVGVRHGQPTEKWANRQLARDQESLDMLKRDVSGWIAHDRRYAAVYLPKISHGPWVNLGDADQKGAGQRAVLARGRSLAAQLDRSLGQILQLLADKGRLQRTLIIVTGDHGLRTWNEVPSSQKNLMDEYAFGVPFLLYAPGILQHTERVPWLTSHIDIEPSVLDLLGISQGRDHEQGSPLWDARLGGRKTFFWASQYLGSDAVFEDDRFYAWNRAVDVVYSASSLHFGDNDVQREQSPQRKRATHDISQMDTIRFSWFRAR